VRHTNFVHRHQGSNINPNICCTSSIPTTWIFFANVPSEWYIQKAGYVLANCDDRPFFSSGSRGDECEFFDRRFAAGRYWFNSKKMARAEGAAGEECQRVDTFVLEDGSKYPIPADMDDARIEYFVRSPVWCDDNASFANSFASSSKPAMEPFTRLSRSSV
jgi:hypothetical protein